MGPFAACDLGVLYDRRLRVFHALLRSLYSAIRVLVFQVNLKEKGVGQYCYLVLRA